MRGFKVTHQVFVLVSVPLIFELIFVALLACLNQRVFDEVEAINRSKDILGYSDRLQSSLYSLLCDGTTFITSQDANVRISCAKHRNDCLDGLERLEMSLAHDYDSETIQSLRNHTYTLIKEADKFISSVKGGGLAALFLGGNRSVSFLQANIDDFFHELEQIRDHELEVTKKRSQAESEARQTLLQAVCVGVIANILIAILLTWGFGKLFIKKLERIVENAKRFADRQDLLPVLAEDTELGYLDRCLHDMTIAVNRAAKRERDIIQHAADVICSLDDKGRFTSVSPAAEQVWLYSPEVLIGTRYNMITADNGELLSRQEQEFLLEAPMKRADEKEIFTTWSVKRSLAETGYFCVVRDVTEKKIAEDNLKASEEEIRTLLSNMFTAVVKVDENGSIISANKRTAELFCLPEDILLGKPLRSIIESPPELSDENSFAQIKERGLDKVFEMNGIKYDGKIVAVDVCLSKYDAFGSQFYVVNILDSSERREIQELKKQFVAMISHDLRTPIASVSSVLELALAGVLGELPENCSKRLARAQDNLQRLMELINDLLELEKLDSGTMQLNRASVSINELFNRATIVVDDLSQRTGIKVESTPIDISIMADEKRLGQVLVNLMSNSIKFSPKGTTIRLSAKDVGTCVEIEVKDEGAGISEEELPHLFDRFSRVSKESNTRIKGTGIGLSICKSIVELHGGKIGVTSKVGVGTSFHIEIPKAN